MPGVQNPHCRALRWTKASCRSAISPLSVQTFNGHHIAAIGLHGEHQAAAHDNTIDAHGTGTTDTVFTTEMRTGEAQLGAQEINEVLTYGHHADNRFAVDGQRNGYCFLGAHAAARTR